MKSCTRAGTGLSPQGDEREAAALDVPQTGTLYSGQVLGGRLPDTLAVCKAFEFVSSMNH